MQAKGIKHDHGKPRPDLILHTMARAVLEVSKVAAFGASKYDDDNWLLVDDANKRYADAKAHHMLQGAIESHDKESGLLHAAHEAWNALALLELKLRGRERLGGRACTDAPITPNWPADADERIDVIGQNGNDGEHYLDTLIGKRAGGGIIIGFEGYDAIIMGVESWAPMDWHKAINFYKGLRHNCLKDWRLPTIDELNFTWVNRDKLQNLNLGDYFYWSSMQISTSYAWAQKSSSGSKYKTSKASLYRVRPVRSVKIEDLEFEGSEAAIVAQPPGDE